MLSYLFSLGFSLAIAEVPINSATPEQLASIDGIDMDTASKIIAFRQQRGQIANLESLRAINLSEVTLDRIRKNVVVDYRFSNDPVTGGKKYSSVKEVLAEFRNEPDVRQVQSMAMLYSKTNPELVEGWLQSVKRAYALPKLNLQYEKQLDSSTRFDYVPTESGTSFEEDYAQVADDDKVVVKLEWRLDKLVMSSEQIRVINESQKTVKLREKLLDEVTRLYFDRRRLQVEGLLQPATSIQDRIEHELRLQEMTANLDALTGGQFSVAIQ